MSLSKKLRFEVFKRDSFTCQYCGMQAPDVILEVDHITPKSKNGTDEILNLVTACFDCNRGKSNKEINDDSVIKKQKKQLDELNERRNQLEMVFKWKEELLKIDDDAINYVVNFFEQKGFLGYELDFNCKNVIRKAYKKYGLQKVIEASEYLYDQFNFSVDEEWEYEELTSAFERQVSALINRLDITIKYFEKNKEKPYLKDLYYIRGILKNKNLILKFSQDYYKIMEVLEEVYLFGVEIEKIKDLAIESDSLEMFIECLSGAQDFVDAYRQ